MLGVGLQSHLIGRDLKDVADLVIARRLAKAT
jgi:hypothetical protein